MIKTILLATDLGVATPHLLEHAANLSQQYQAKLVVIHSIEPLGAVGQAILTSYLPSETSQALTTDGIDALAKQVRAQIIDHLTEEFMAGQDALSRVGDVIVRLGQPADTILQAAQSVEADMIIMGNRSDQNGITDEMGTVTRKVIRATKIPVYVVPLFQATWQQDGLHQLKLC